MRSFGVPIASPGFIPSPVNECSGQTTSRRVSVDMDHHEQHHQHHRKERQEKKHHEHEHEREQEKKPRVIHPVWLLVLGILATLGAVLVWVLF